MTLKGPLTPRQEKALAALMNSLSIEEASRLSGLSVRVFYKYLKDDTFQQQYMKARKDALSQALSGAQSNVSEAVKTLLEIAKDQRPKANQSARVSAARVLLDMSLKSLEYQEIIVRLEKLEQEISDRQEKGYRKNV